MRPKRLTLVCTVLTLFAAGTASGRNAPPAPNTTAPVAPAMPKLKPDGPHLLADDVTLPLVLVKGYPFVEGAINGHRGKLLFDIGEDEAMSVDVHTVAVPNGVPVGRGFFGSGERFDVVRLPVVDSLTLPEGLSFQGMTNIRGNPGLPLEQHITPDFIGWLGDAFIGDHLLVLDYAASTARLVRNDASGDAARRLTAGQRVVRTIMLGNRAHLNLQTLPIAAGGVELQGTLDTGSHDALWVTTAQEAALEAAGVLKVSTHDREQGVVSGLTIDGLALPPQPVEISRSAPPMAKLLPRKDLPLLTLGYEFLKAYKTVWDFQHGTLTLLTNQAHLGC